MDPRAPVLVFEGEYSLAVVLVSALQAHGIEASFDDLPVGAGRGPSGSRIYVMRADEADAPRIIGVASATSRR